MTADSPPFPVFPEEPAEASRACPICGRDAGTGLACAFCGQLLELPDGVALSSASRRLGAYLLDLVLLSFAVGIDLTVVDSRISAVTGVAFLAWLVWVVVVWARGQTPGKQLLGMRTVKLRTGRKASWGVMFVREFLLKLLLFSLVLTITLGLGLILYFWLLWDAKRQELWDKMVGTIVVEDPRGLLR